MEYSPQSRLTALINDLVLMQHKFFAHRFGQCRIYFLAVNDSNLIDRHVNITAPVNKNFMQFRILWSEVVETPNEALVKDRMIRHVIQNLHGRQAKTFQLECETIDHSTMLPAIAQLKTTVYGSRNFKSN